MAKSAYPSQDIYGYRYEPFVVDADQISGDLALGGQDLGEFGELSGYTPVYKPNADANSALYVNALPQFDNRADGQVLAVVRLTQALPGVVPQYGPDGELLGQTPYGGTATTIIDIDDSGDAYAKQTIGADAIALGGNGVYINYYDIYHNYGDDYVGAPSLGPAGPANAVATVKSNYFADARAQAEVAAADEGNVATATSDAEGPHARSTAFADDYSGSRESAGGAIAVASAKGVDGGADDEAVGWDGSQYPFYSGAPITALSTTAVGDPIVVSSASAMVAAPVNGSSKTEAFARIGGALPTADLPIPTGLQGVAFIQGYPDAGADDQFLTGFDAHVEGAFDQPDARVLALGELGVGSPDTTTPSVQTTTSTITYSMGFANVPALLSNYFEVGFSPVSITGTDIQEIDLSITANGSDLLTESFKSISDAAAYLTDHVVDLGLLSSLATGSTVVHSILYGYQDPAVSFTNNLTIGASLKLVGTNAQADVAFLFGTVSSPTDNSGPSVTLAVPETLVNSEYVPVQGTLDLVQPGGTTIDLYDNGVYKNSVTATSGNWSGNVMITGEGQHDITAKVGTSVSNDIVVTLDTTPPALSFSSDATRLTNGTLTLSGTVSDPSGVREVDISLDDGSLGIATVAGGTWTYVTTLPPPKIYQSVAVYAFDNAGNENAVYSNLPLATGQDGFIVGATVFNDENGNGSFDPGEETTTTGPGGFFIPANSTAPEILTGGTDNLTGLPFTGVLEAPAYSVVISPLTTLIEKVAEAAGDTTSGGTMAAETAVQNAFGLGTGFNSITGIDSLGSLLDPTEDFAFFAGPVVQAASLLYDTQTLIDAAGGSSAAALTALAAAIAGGGTYDTASFIADGGLTGEAAAAVLDVVTRTEDALNQQLSDVYDGSVVVVDSTGADIALQKDAAGLFAQSGGHYADAAVSYDNELAQLLTVDDATAQQNVDTVACYCLDTLIMTASGEAPVEMLEIGDMLKTASGAYRPIKWIGRRSYAGRFLAGNQGVQPIRFHAGSLGNGLPCRDLLVSPEHAMLLDGLLVPARCLVNGSSIVQERGLKQVDYFHVELDTHDIILAEGAPSETFLDDDSRGAFHNAHEFAALYPDTPSPGGFCAPRVDGGPLLAAIRQRLNGVGVQEVEIDAAGSQILAVRDNACAVRLVSQAGYAHGDARRLGAAISRIAVDGVDLALDDPRLAAGWHDCEGAWRWTDGAALVLTRGAKQIDVTVAALALAAAA
jgi:hypothetical protein